MNKVQHESNNLVLGAPKGWDQSTLPCGALPVTAVSYPDIGTTISSYWKPSEEELIAMMRGEFIVLTVFSDTMPPVALSVQK